MTKTEIMTKLQSEQYKECMRQCQELIDKEIGNLEVILYVRYLRQQREGNKKQKQ
jgi:hypothetical protein